MIEQAIGDGFLALDHGIDALLDGSAANELVDQNIPLLADAKGAVGGLILDGRVPPTVEMDHVAGRGEVQSAATGLQGNHEEWRPLFILKRPHQFAALANRRGAVQYQAAWPKTSARNTANGSVNV